MKLQYVAQDGTANGIDFEAHYRVNLPHWRGITFYLLGWAADLVVDPEDETEWHLLPDNGAVVAVMVGDNARHRVDVSDLVLLGEDEFCHTCGQIGCSH